ncbi:MAG: hypothetical protein UY70_C0023G0003 [Candidatus Kaiserbacteria bacterium GW2011_GWB1_52_6]|uniref:Uncharacterized protein n=3 Tax=Candidatus Kaiseribacteriota TaxID=1752734 RepID=A0A0G1XHL4_9BACT|nr:MAG: hypothetical protein UY67_C0009G0003 [Candidatus Kaiserbacteria bacterium GW2011_GWA2_52_12]KKW26468.1 MAG: hypothetical protein UY70_C0023G0003 [Candidatus Kaiserbacteria bacterium GW2011_GWB1_52_6]KKW30446.1 MAG: hypothetical protein UY74_C0041G0010 [Candidatus Kaiserbacteria bacterium GW2011_GWC2_52_8b]
MATTKQRINISVSKSTHDALMLLAKRDQEPLATKAGELVEFALELEEDRMLSEIAAKRDVKGVRWIKDNDRIWK